MRIRSSTSRGFNPSPREDSIHYLECFRHTTSSASDTLGHVDAYSYAKGKIRSTFNVLSDTFTRGAFNRLEELKKKEVGITPTPLARVCNPCVARGEARKDAENAKEELGDFLLFRLYYRRFQPTDIGVVLKLALATFLKSLRETTKGNVAKAIISCTNYPLTKVNGNWSKLLEHRWN